MRRRRTRMMLPCAFCMRCKKRSSIGSRSNGQHKIEMGPAAVTPTEVMTTTSPPMAEDAIASPHVTESVEIEEQDFLCGKFGVQGFEDVCKFFFNPSDSKDTQVPLLLGDTALDPASSANLSTETGPAEGPERKSDAEREERLEPTTRTRKQRAPWKKMFTRKEKMTEKPRKAGSSRPSRILSRFRGPAAASSRSAKTNKVSI